MQQNTLTAILRTVTLIEDITKRSNAGACNVDENKDPLGKEVGVRYS